MNEQDYRESQDHYCPFCYNGEVVEDKYAADIYFCNSCFKGVDITKLPYFSQEVKESIKRFEE